MRNIGSSIGISVTTLLLVRYTTMMHANLAETSNPFRLPLRAHMPGMDLATAAGRALMDQEVTAQASAIAYGNNFRLMMYGALVVIPLALLLRNPLWPETAGRS